MGHAHGAPDQDRGPSGSGGPARGPLSARVRRARRRGFVGRLEQQAAVRGPLADGAVEPRVFLVHGLAGIGKTALLRRIADEAEEQGRAVARVEATEPSRLRSTLEGWAAAAGDVTGDVRRPLLLIDGFETCTAVETWLREDLLQRLPEDVVVVVAGRWRPDPRWTSDPGWRDLVHPMHLGGLAREEAQTLLSDLGVPTARRPAVLGFTGGHPLALCLAAETAGGAPVDGGDAERWEPSRELIETLLDLVVGDVPASARGRALRVCAHAGETTVDLLRAQMVEGEAVDAFRWLRGLPYVEAGPDGLHLHHLVRELLTDDLRWRDPEDHDEMHQRLWGYAAQRAVQASGEMVRPAVSSLVSLYRHRSTGTDVRSEPLSQERLVEHPYEPRHRSGVLHLAHEEGGAEHAALVASWLDRQPQAFHLCSPRGGGEPVSFLAVLRLTQRRGTEEADPVVALVRQHVDAGGLVRPDEEVILVRFVVPAPRATWPTASAPARVRRIATEVLRSAGTLAVAFIVVPDPQEHAESLAGVGFRQVAEVPVRRGRPAGLFAHDFRKVPLRALLATMRTLQKTDPRPERTAVDDLHVLEREVFDRGVRQALRDWHDADALRANPLVRTRFATERDPDDPVAGVRREIEAAVAHMPEQPRGVRGHLAVTATYLDRSLTQEAAASRLGLPFSTYRRHLARGVAAISARLWQAEQHGVRR